MYLVSGFICAIIPSAAQTYLISPGRIAQFVGRVHWCFQGLYGNIITYSRCIQDCICLHIFMQMASEKRLKCLDKHLSLGYGIYKNVKIVHFWTQIFVCTTCMHACGSPLLQLQSSNLSFATGAWQELYSYISDLVVFWHWLPLHVGDNSCIPTYPSLYFGNDYLFMNVV